MRKSLQQTSHFSTFRDAAVRPLAAKLRGGSLSFTRVGFGRAPCHLHIRTPSLDGYYVIFQLADHAAHEHWIDGRARPAPPSPRGSLHIADLNRTNEAVLRSPFDSLNLVLDRALLDALAEEAGAPSPAELRVPVDWTTADPVVARLAPVLQAALEDPAATTCLFIDHLGIATATHLAAQYGGLRPVVLRPGGLAPWQERRACEMIAAHLAKEVSLADVAAECSLSPSHFAKAFKVSVGLTPHGWLQASRVQRARDLLRDRDLPLAEIAAICGFADQSHFNRIFRRATGTTPGAWRRARLS